VKKDYQWVMHNFPKEHWVPKMAEMDAVKMYIHKKQNGLM
jgi:hypothetical protein